MPIFILSKENIRTLKNVLMTDYAVCSSHASELIAALCGFNCYAALKSELDSFTFAPAVRIDSARFEVRHSELGYDQISAEWLGTSFIGLPFQDRPWLSYTTSRRGIRDPWFEHCERNSIPFITIHRKRKYCYLEWDCISIDTKFESHVRGESGDEMGRSLFRQYQLIANGQEPKSYYIGSAFYGNVTKISENTARALANEFFLKLTPWK